MQHAAQEWVDKLHLCEILNHEPTSRYWAFQWDETAIFVGLALLLAGICLRWVRRRLS